MSSSTTATYTYSVADIEVVIRRFSADISMIAQSSGTITESEARDYAHDTEVLAKHGYLRMVDLTLLSGGVEVRAAQYLVDLDAGGLTTSRPGGVMWPRVADPFLQVILFYTSAYDDTAREAIRGKLKIPWVPTRTDTSHAALVQSSGRDYASNGWGLRRRDYAR